MKDTKEMKNRGTLHTLRLRLRAGGLNAALLLLLCLLLAAVNLLVPRLEERFHWQADLSFNQLTTTSQETQQILADLSNPVHIYALYERGSEDLPLLEILSRYSALTELVTCERVDVSMEPALLSAFADNPAEEPVTAGSVIVYCEATGRHRILGPSDFVSIGINMETGGYEVSGITYERSITSAILSVSRKEERRVMVLQGHGEPDMAAGGVLAQLLAGNGYDVYYFTLNNAQAKLSGSDLLVCMAPQKDLTDQELQKILDFAAQGGSLLISCDYTDPIEQMPNYASLLRSYGILPRRGLVLAGEDAGCFSGNRVYLLPTMEDSDITHRQLQAGRTTLLLPAARAFEEPETMADRDLVVSPVLRAGQKAYLHDLSDGQTGQLPTDPVGDFPLALLSRRFSAQGDVSRALAVGCTAMLTSTDVYAMTDTEEFIIRAVQHLMGEDMTVSSIPARTALRPALGAGSVHLGTVLLVLLPMAVLLSGAAVLTRRRHM